MKIACELVIAKPEHFIFLERAPQAEATLVPLERGRAKSFSIFTRAGNLLGKRISRKGRTIAMEIKRRTVKIIGP